MSRGREFLVDKVTDITVNAFIKHLQRNIPLTDRNLLQGVTPKEAGNRFQGFAEDFFCETLKLPENNIALEPRIRGRNGRNYRTGDVYSNGVSCGNRAQHRPGGNIPRPDFVVGPDVPLQANGRHSHSYLIGDIKLSQDTFYNSWLSKSVRQKSQWRAITGYARRHTVSRTAVLVSLYEGKPTKAAKANRADLVEEGIKRGVLVLPLSVLN